MGGNDPLVAPIRFLPYLIIRMFETVIVFFSFFLPFQFALHPAEGVDLASMRVFAIGMFLWWCARSLSERRLALPRPLPFFLFLSFLIWASASFLWADNVSWSLRKTAFLLSFFPLFLVASSFFRDAHLRKRVFQALVCGSSAAALLALLQFFSQFIFGVERTFSFWVRDTLPFFLGSAFGEAVASYPSLLVNISGVTVMRASGLFPDPHMAAFFFGTTFFLALSFAWKSVGAQRSRWLLCAAIIFMADLLTFSRGGYIGLVFGSVAFFSPLFSRYVAEKKQGVWIGLSSLIVIIVIFMSPVGTRLLSSFSQSDGSNIERLRLWQEAGGSIALHPILGVGLGNYPLVVKPSAVYREPIYAHNLFLDVTLETGLVGLFFFVAFLSLGIISAWRGWRQERSVFSLAIFSSLIVFSAHSFFETPIFSVHILPLFLLLMAAGISSPRRHETDRLST